MTFFVVLTLTGYFSFTLMDFFVQHLVQLYPITQVTFFNSLTTFFLVLFFFPIFFNRKLLRIVHYKVHLVRGLGILVMDISAFYSYKENSLSAAYSLILTAPIIASVLSVFVEKSKFTVKMWFCTLMAFVGVLIVLNPSFEGSNSTLIFALIAAIIDGLTIIHYRIKGAKETTISFVITTNFLIAFILAPYVIIHFKPMPMPDLAMNITSGFFLTVGIAIVLYVLRLREVMLVGTLQYSQILWAILINAVIFKTYPSLNVAVGCIIITLSSISLIWLLSREKNKVNNINVVTLTVKD